MTPAAWAEVVPDRYRGFFRRPRVDAFLDQFSDRSLILIDAPPGSGVTQTLVHWRRLLMAAGVITCWCPGGRSPQGVIATLLARTGSGAAAAQRVHLDEADSQLDHELAALSRINRRFALLVDGIDFLAPRRVDLGWANLLDRLPSNCQLIGAGPGEALRELASRLAYAQVGIVTEIDLAFTPAEAAGMLAQAGGLDSASDALARLVDVAEGWPVALDAFASKLRGGADAATMLAGAHLAPESVATFVGKTILAPLPKRLRADLADLTKLQRLERGLIKSVTRSTGLWSKIAALRKTTPLFVPDAEMPRFRILVKDVLARGEQESRTGDHTIVHARASAWFKKQGRFSDAMPHLVALGRTDLASETLDRCLFETVSAGGVRAALRWLHAMPDEEVRANMSLKAAAAWTLAVGGDASASKRLLELETDPAWLQAVSPQQRAIMGALMAVHADDPDLASNLLSVDLDWTDLSEASAIVRRNLLSWIRQQSGLERTVTPSSDASPHSYRIKEHLFDSECFGAFRAAVHSLAMGRARAAAELVRPLLERSEAELGREAAPSILLSAVLAAAYCQYGAREAARAAIAGRIDLLQAHATPEALWLGMSTAARLAFDDGDSDHAFNLLERLERDAAARDLVRVETLVRAERMRMLTSLGQTRRAAAMADLLRDTLESIKHDSGIRAANVRLAAELGLAHQLTGLQDQGAARRALLAAGRSARRLNRARDLSELRILASRLAPSGVERSTLFDARHRIEVADLDQLIGDLAVRGTPLAPTRTPLRAHRRTCDHRHERPPVLTQRETEIIELLERSMSNRAVAHALCVGEETIKWHLKNLFAKLGAHDRRSAVEIVRSFSSV